MFMLTSWCIELQLLVVLGTSLHFRGTPTLADVLAEKAMVISAFICVHLRFTKPRSIPVAAAPRCVHPWFPFFFDNATFLAPHSPHFVHSSEVLKRGNIADILA
jgi:hypothetical protein